MKSNAYKLVAASLMVCALVAAFLFGQKPDEGKEEKKDLPKTKSTGDFKPNPTARAVVRITGFKRTVRIHEADQTEGNEGLYCHRPLFAFLENTDPIKDGLPDIVMKRRLLPDGTTRLEFEVQLTTQAFRQVAEDEVRNQDIDRIKKRGRLDQVKVVAWPLTHAVIDCKMNGSVLASGETESLNSADETMSFALTFTPETLKQFKEGVKAGDVVFTFYYTFENRKVAKGQVTTEASKSTNIIVGQKLALRLTPQQRDGTMPIFQRHVNTIEREVRAEVLRTVRATHKDILPLLDTSNSLVGRIFELNKEITMEELEGDKDLKEHVAKYLAPLINTVVNAKQVDVRRIDEDEMTLTDVDRTKVGFGITLSIYTVEVGTDAEVESETTKVKRNLLKNEYGVSLKEDRAKQHYVPASIKVYKMARGYMEANVFEATTAFLGIGEKNDDYLEESPVSANYTLKTVEKQFGSVIETRFYDGVPLGTMLPYFGFGDLPPRGYVWADGNSEWPNDAWVPQHLRGKKVPKMDGFLLAGTDAVAQVGKEWTDGAIVVPQFTIEGRKFTLPKEVADSSRIADDGIVLKWTVEKTIEDRFLVGAQPPSAPELGEKIVKAVAMNGQAYRGRYVPVPATYAVVRYPGNLGGSQTIDEKRLSLSSPESNPRHVKCRWMIRVQ